jgi:hypothetical protein
MQVVIPGRKKGFSYRVAVRRARRVRSRSVVMLGQVSGSAADENAILNAETLDPLMNPETGETILNPEL